MGTRPAGDPAGLYWSCGLRRRAERFGRLSAPRQALAGPGLPALDDLLASAHVVRLPLHVRFRGVTEREALLLPGPFGWGEFAPFPEYADPEASSWLASGLADAYAEPVAVVRDSVPVNATVPAVAAADVKAVLARYDGCSTVKIKVAERGQSLADDLARVAQVRRLAGPEAHLRVDANGGWTVPEATRALTALAQYGLQYAEQPCASVSDLVALRARLQDAGAAVPIAADESIRKASDPLAVARTGAIDVAVVKVAPLGGVRRLLGLAAELSALRVRLVVSSALDTSVGLAAGVRAAAALPGEPLACGLGTASLLAADVVQVPLRAERGRLAVRDVRPDPERLAALAVDGERRQWWLDRLTRCYQLLAQECSSELPWHPQVSVDPSAPRASRAGAAASGRPQPPGEDA